MDEIDKRDLSPDGVRAAVLEGVLPRGFSESRSHGHRILSAEEFRNPTGHSENSLWRVHAEQREEPSVTPSTDQLGVESRPSLQLFQENPLILGMRLRDVART